MKPALTIAAAVLLAAAPASAQSTRRGPIEVREEFLFAQTRLSLPSLAPDPLPAGATRVEGGLDWGSDFALKGSEPRLDHLVDGEHRTLAIDVRRGVTPRLTLGVRVPVRWRGPGVLDGLIDTWHDVSGLPDNDRGLYPRNRFRMEGRGADGVELPIEDDTGTGLGHVEVMGLWAARTTPVGWAVSLVGRAELPTGTGPFAGAGGGFGAQALVAHPLGRTVDLFAGAGGTVFTSTRQAGLEYARARAHAFTTLEWRPGRPISILIETSLASRLVRNIARYPGRQLYFRMGAKVDLGRRWQLEGGFVEGLSSIQATTDFGIQAGLVRRF